jgi:hypothetical protein
VLTYLPKFVSEKAIMAYLVSLVICQLIFAKYLLPLNFMLIGAVSTVGFFYFSNQKTIQWQKLVEKTFEKRIFWTALALRVVWVVFSYYFYISQTGAPFEFHAADVMAYHSGGQEVRQRILDGTMDDWSMLQNAPSDAGYMLMLGIEYLFTNNSIFIARIIKAIFSAFVVVFIYKIARNNFDEKTGRIAAIFACFLPNFIYYCGLHQKETEMIFFAVWFVERTDYLIRNKNIKLVSIVHILLLAIVLFLFRTVLGAVAVLSIIITFLLSAERKTNWGNRIIGFACVIVFIGFMAGTKIMLEVETVWENRTRNQETSMQWRSQRESGNIFSKYGNVAIFAPLMFTIPLATMTKTPTQENVQLMNGANFVKNVMSFFVIFGLFMLFYRKIWRKHLLILSFMSGYLAVIAMSGFAQSERFHIPALPFEVIISAYGLSLFTNKQKTLFNYWIFGVIIAEIAWNYIKLKGRGMA